MENYQPHKDLSHGQKTGVVLLLVFALLVVGLGVLQIRNTIYGPFVLRLSGDREVRELITDESTRLQQIDTDKDGLNDYEELYFYETSPYLVDTDSDGMSDKQEIESGVDPLCPKGGSCDAEAIDLSNIPDRTILSPLVDSVATPAEMLLMTPTLTNENSTSSPNIFGVLGDPVQLRQMLLSSGKIKQEDLDKIDDDALLEMAQGFAQENFGDLNPSSEEDNSASE